MREEQLLEGEAEVLRFVSRGLLSEDIVMDGTIMSGHSCHQLSSLWLGVGKGIQGKNDLGEEDDELGTRRELIIERSVPLVAGICDL